jgi:F-type H+-transporting ATPase subunit delta
MANADTKHDTVFDAGTTQSRLARVYAESLMVAAAKQSPAAIQDIGEELTEFTRAITVDSPALGAFLTSPAVGKKQKASVLETALQGRSSDLLRGLLAVLSQNNRLGLLRSIAAAYRGLLDERAGRVRVKVTTAVPLGDDQKTKLTASLKGLLNQEPVLDVRVEPDLLGGMLVQVGDSVIDTTVRTRLQSLRKLLLEKGTSHGN